MKDDLIGRLEAATGPARELDARIWWECGPGKTDWPHHADKSALDACGIIWGRNPKGTRDWRNVSYAGPRYTASIDGALTLVPEGWFVHRLHQWVADNFNWSCDLAKKDLSNPMPVSAEDRPTPALAIVIAALRAMP